MKTLPLTQRLHPMQRHAPQTPIGRLYTQLNQRQIVEPGISGFDGATAQNFDHLQGSRVEPRFEPPIRRSYAEQLHIAPRVIAPGTRATVGGEAITEVSTSYKYPNRSLILKSASNIVKIGLYGSAAMDIFLTLFHAAKPVPIEKIGENYVKTIEELFDMTTALQEKGIENFLMCSDGAYWLNLP
jgi:hypothetical protein